MAHYNPERAVSLPSFSGKQEDYPRWIMQYRAYARLYKFQAALGDSIDPEMPADENVIVDTTTAAGALQAAAVKQNDAAMATLTLALSHEENIAMILAASTTNWPGGEAHLVMSAMKRKYKPKDTVALVEQS